VVVYLKQLTALNHCLFKGSPCIKGHRRRGRWRIPERGRRWFSKHPAGVSTFM